LKKLFLVILFLSTNSIWAQSSLIGFWSFDSTLADSLGIADGTFSDGNPVFVEGRYGQAIELDGIDDYVVLGTSTDLNFGTDIDFSVALWAKTDGWNTDAAIISNKDWNSGSNTGWLISGGSGSGTWQWNYCGAESPRVDYDPSGPQLNDGFWHHLCVTHDRDGMAKLYFDGFLQEEIDISASTGTLDAGFPTVVGTDGAEGIFWPYWFAGVIDELRIYDDVLTQTEIDTLSQKPPTPIAVGHWSFNDTLNILEGETGNELTLTGNHSFVAGPTDSNSAVNIGLWSYYTVSHGIAANGAGNKVNEYTLVMDIQIPDLGIWYSIYQTDTTNSNDAECFINQSGQIGNESTEYTELQLMPNEWYRVVISVDNGSFYNYYVDGKLILNGNPGTIDERFALDSTLLFFADNNNRDNPIDIADIKIFSTALTGQQISDMGGFKHKAPTEISEPYLQAPTTNSIWVTWHTTADTESVVYYGLTESLGDTMTGSCEEIGPDYFWHQVELEGLTANTPYYYKCATGPVQTSVYRFVTQPEPEDSTRHYRFILYGDSRSNPGKHNEVVNAAITKCEELYGGPVEDHINLVVNVGDVVGSGGNFGG